MVRLKASRLGLDFERRKLLMIELTKNNWNITPWVLTPWVTEIHLGERTVMDYLLSPVQKTVREAGRER